MSRTYKATGINLKSMPLGETDKLVTILTQELGIIRVVAPGVRKQNSKLGGRMGLFVVNELLVAKGRSLDKITQAETLLSYPGLSRELSKLAASQYLAELVLCHALSEEPQTELYQLFNEHLRRLEALPTQGDHRSGISSVLGCLSHGIFHLLALAGIAPQVQMCCLTQHPLQPHWHDSDWRVGFSIEAGGTINLAPVPDGFSAGTTAPEPQNLPRLNTKLNALELTLLQHLATAELPNLDTVTLNPLSQLSTFESLMPAWVNVEKLLREYSQYHFGRSIRSAALVDALSINLC